MKYNTYRIKDICKIKSGKRIPLGKDFVTYKTPYPYIRARDIKNGKISTDGLIYLEEDVYKTIKKYIINNGDVAITIVGASIGDIAYADKEVDGYNLTENAVRLTLFKEFVNSKYIFYLLSQKPFHNYMQTIAGGAAQPKLGIYKIEKIKVEIPDLLTQGNVVSILKKYDYLIETNIKRIDVLEKMAEELYKEWFVRFHFPGYERNSLINSKFGKSPKDFTIVKMQDVIDYYIGGGWGNDDEDKSFTEAAYVIRGTDFSHVSKGDLSTCPLRFHKASNYKSRKLIPLDVILEVSGGTAEQPVGRTLLVTKDTIERLGGKVICASFCKQIRLNQNIVSPYYFYYWMQFLYNTRIIDRFQLQSTGIINFKFEYFLRKGDLLLPPKELMDRFDERIIPIFDEISLISKQNENLIKQRDLLLPRLMSGKLEV